MTAAVVLERATVRYGRGEVPAVDRISLSIPAGQRVAVIGPSGAGKTTLLRLVNGLIRPTAGRLAVLGVDLADGAARRREFRRRIGFVLQDFPLVERASVQRNVLCGRLGWTGGLAGLLGCFSETDRALAATAMEETGLADLARRRADSLSGGQRQRAAIARVLAQDPDLLTADEPVSNLDPVLATAMLRSLAGAGRRRGGTSVVAVHHPALAREFAERIVGMAAGRIVYDGDRDGPLDAAALRAIYGRGPGPEPVGAGAAEAGHGGFESRVA